MYCNRHCNIRALFFFCNIGFKMHWVQLFCCSGGEAFLEPSSGQMGFPKPCRSAKCFECPLPSDAELLSKLLWKHCLFSLPALKKSAQRVSLFLGGCSSPRRVSKLFDQVSLIAAIILWKRWQWGTSKRVSFYSLSVLRQSNISQLLGVLLMCLTSGAWFISDKHQIYYWAMVFKRMCFSEEQCLHYLFCIKIKSPPYLWEIIVCFVG